MLFILQSILDKALGIPIEVSVASPNSPNYIFIYLREVNLNGTTWDQIGFIVVLYKFLSQECVSQFSFSEQRITTCYYTHCDGKTVAKKDPQ